VKAKPGLIERNTGADNRVLAAQKIVSLMKHFLKGSLSTQHQYEMEKRKVIVALDKFSTVSLKCFSLLPELATFGWF
jgi:hypothetical protein